MVARLERNKTPDSDNSAAEATAAIEAAAEAIEQFRRLTAEEIQATLQAPQQSRYSARVQVASAISQETVVLQRKLAAIIERTQDIEIRRLLKALHQKYICLDIRELGSSRTYIEELVEKTNAYLTKIASTAKTDLNPIIHVRNGYVLVGPMKRYEPVHVIDNEDTRKTIHYSGVEISKPEAALPEQNSASKSSPLVSQKKQDEAAPEKGSFLRCVRDNRGKFEGRLGDIDYRIAEGIAQAVDKPGPARGDEDGTTIQELEKKLKIADYTITARLKKIGRIFQRMGITLDIEATGDDADTDRITILWTASLESDFGGYEPVEKEGEDGDDKDGDDEDEVDRKGTRGKTPSRGNAESMKKREDPNDIFPAFRGVKFTTAEQFNKMIVEILGGDKGICTYEGNASSDDARKLMRSIEACEVEASIKARVEEWKRKLSLGMHRFKKYGCLYKGAIAVLLRGIEVKVNET